MTDSMIVHADNSLLLLQPDVHGCKVKHIHTHRRPQLSFTDTKDMLHHSSAFKNEKYLLLKSCGMDSE